MSGLIFVQSACKGYEQMTLVGNEVIINQMKLSPDIEVRDDFDLETSFLIVSTREDEKMDRKTDRQIKKYRTLPTNSHWRDPFCYSFILYNFQIST